MYKNYKNKSYNKRPKTKEELFEEMLKKALKTGNEKQKDKNKRNDKKVKDHRYKLPSKKKDESKAVEDDE